MKARVLLAVLAMCVLVSATFADDQGLKSGDLLAICGDSITEQKQYSVFMEDYLVMCRPDLKVEANQLGWGGEIAKGFLGRMESDCLVFHPTAATTFYGMNDGGYAALTPERSAQYHDSTRDIVQGFKKAGLHLIVVGSPGVVDSHSFQNPDGKPRSDKAIIYNKTLGQLADIARQVAADEHVGFVDVHATMTDAMEKAKTALGDDYEFAGRDGVHPGANGHLVTAYAFLKALGCDGNIGTITLDQETGKAIATDGHKVLSANATALEIESSRYPFCFFPPANNAGRPSATNEIIEYFPFNQDLNRFMLVVKNVSAAKLKVTWGESARVFSEAQLETGINLAAEFLENPFCKPFKTVEQAIRNQQNWETPAVKTWLHHVPEYKGLLTEEGETFQKLVDATVKRDAGLRHQAAAAMVPVKHTIRFEPVP